MSVQPPNDELDERWRAMHEHPELAQIPNFDAVDLVEKAHANDKARAENSRPPSSPRRHTSNDDANDDPDNGEEASNEQPGLFEDGPHATADEAAGHEMIHARYQRWLDTPHEVDVEDYPL